ncbi:MAG: helix-turn-helix domain-containing protein [Candidatus Marsarchaeota archaeon]|nr:helix-turn-helix domain-containing protein [Candidatus Marsarchaeota archaeon]MCL5112464.1 helix-turn-helix domain-containing protein [Candidatus Marsarchaeota archaeon]
MYADCAKLTRISIPASRLAIAIELRRSGKMSQADIASLLGVAQASISKYENGKLSGTISELARYIIDRGIADKAVSSISRNTSKSSVAKEIDLLASSSRVFRKASALVSAIRH